jgi:hypothetical protein
MILDGGTLGPLPVVQVATWWPGWPNPCQRGGCTMRRGDYLPFCHRPTRLPITSEPGR